MFPGQKIIADLETLQSMIRILPPGTMLACFPMGKQMKIFKWEFYQYLQCVEEKKNMDMEEEKYGQLSSEGVPS